MNGLKLTLWEAAEVHFNEGVLLAAVCDDGYFCKILNVFYDKRTKKVCSWDINLRSKDKKIAPNLLNGSITEAPEQITDS